LQGGGVSLEPALGESPAGKGPDLGVGYGLRKDFRPRNNSRILGSFRLVWRLWEGRKRATMR